MSWTLLMTELAGSCFQLATILRMLFIDSLLLLVHRLGIHVWTGAIYNMHRQQGQHLQTDMTKKVLIILTLTVSYTTPTDE